MDMTDTGVVYRTCTQCGRTLPLTPAYWYRNHHNRLGLDTSRCKHCQAVVRFGNRWPTRREHYTAHLAAYRPDLPPVGPRQAGQKLEAMLPPALAELARALAYGPDNKTLASRLHKQVATIKNQMSMLLTRFNVRSRGELIARLHSEGWLMTPDEE
jgi:DNA-binding CsgD family transcriptional regulator